MRDWGFLTNHGRALLCIAHDPGVRLRDIAAGLGITERRAYGIVTELTAAGYVLKERDGRRNRYQIQVDVPLSEPTARERTIGDLLDLLVRAGSSSGSSSGSASRSPGGSPGRSRRELPGTAGRRA